MKNRFAIEEGWHPTSEEATIQARKKKHLTAALIKQKKFNKQAAQMRHLTSPQEKSKD